MTMEKLLTATEVCVIIDCSIYTLNNWYTFKRQQPENEYSQMLPDFVTKEDGARKKRYWKQSDIGKLLEFKTSIPHGRNGVLGAVTQKYAKRKGSVKVNGRKKVNKKDRSRVKRVREQVQ